jgi:hypothetical protein
MYGAIQSKAVSRRKRDNVGDMILSKSFMLSTENIVQLEEEKFASFFTVAREVFWRSNFVVCQ